MAYRVEMQLSSPAWDQPIIVLLEDERFAVKVAQAVRREFRRPVRVTKGAAPENAPADWAVGDVIFLDG